MSCCNFGNRGFGPRRGFDRNGGGFDNRRGCCEVNWGSCRNNRFCPRRDPYRPNHRRPY